MSYLRTSDLAKAVGFHPNTVRRYVDRGILPPVERSPSGYRRFTQRHLDCLRVARQVYGNQYPGKAIYQSGIRIISATVSGDLGVARELAHSHLALVQAERRQADIAADLLEHWAAEATISPLSIGQVAHLLGVTIDILRNWDRNGLIDVPRSTPLVPTRTFIWPPTAGSQPNLSTLEVTRSLMTAHITIRGARLHNLKNVTLTIPKNQLVVLTRVSSWCMGYFPLGCAPA